MGLCGAARGGWIDMMTYILGFDPRVDSTYALTIAVGRNGWTAALWLINNTRPIVLPALREATRKGYTYLIPLVVSSVNWDDVDDYMDTELMELVDMITDERIKAKLTRVVAERH